MEKEKETKKEELSLEEIKKKLEECQKLKDEYLAGWQRARADLLNYKKEEMERVGGFLKYADVGLILKILPILDNFEKAEKEIPDDKKNDKFLEGLLQIKNQLQDFLKNQGVEEIKCLGEKFDPNLHDVVGEVSPSEVLTKEGVSSSEALAKDKESGIIIEEIQKGYKINGRLLRPAKVRVMK